MMGAQAYGAMMWVCPCEQCDHMMWGQAIDKVHRHMTFMSCLASLQVLHIKRMW